MAPGGSAWWTSGRPVGRRNGVRLHPPSCSCRRETLRQGRVKWGGIEWWFNGIYGDLNGGFMGFYETKMGPPLKPNDLENKVTFENTHFAVGPMFGRSRRLSVVPSHKFFLLGRKTIVTSWEAWTQVANHTFFLRLGLQCIVTRLMMFNDFTYDWANLGLHIKKQYHFTVYCKPKHMIIIFPPYFMISMARKQDLFRGQVLRTSGLVADRLHDSHDLPGPESGEYPCKARAAVGCFYQKKIRLKQYIGEKIRWDMVRWWATHVSCSVFLCSFFLRIILSCDRLAMPPTNFPLLDPTTSTSWDKCTDVTFAPRRVPWVKLEASIPVYYIYIYLRIW